MAGRDEDLRALERAVAAGGRLEERLALVEALEEAGRGREWHRWLVRDDRRAQIEARAAAEWERVAGNELHVSHVVVWTQGLSFDVYVGRRPGPGTRAAYVSLDGPPLRVRAASYDPVWCEEWLDPRWNVDVLEPERIDAVLPGWSRSSVQVFGTSRNLDGHVEPGDVVGVARNPGDDARIRDLERREAAGEPGAGQELYEALLESGLAWEYYAVRLLERFKAARMSGAEARRRGWKAHFVMETPLCPMAAGYSATPSGTRVADRERAPAGVSAHDVPYDEDTSRHLPQGWTDADFIRAASEVMAARARPEYRLEALLERTNREFLAGARWAHGLIEAKDVALMLSRMSAKGLTSASSATATSPGPGRAVVALAASEGDSVAVWFRFEPRRGGPERETEKVRLTRDEASAFIGMNAWRRRNAGSDERLRRLERDARTGGLDERLAFVAALDEEGRGGEWRAWLTEPERMAQIEARSRDEFDAAMGRPHVARWVLAFDKRGESSEVSLDGGRDVDVVPLSYIPNWADDEWFDPRWRARVLDSGALKSAWPDWDEGTVEVYATSRSLDGGVEAGIVRQGERRGGP